MTDIYYNQQAFESESALIRKAHFTDEDRIFGFINERADLSLSRRIRYMVTLRTARAFLNKPFAECAKEDFIKYVQSLQGKKPNTRSTELKQLKVFYRWLKTGSVEAGAPYPPEVAWIKANVKRNEMTELDILSPGEVEAMIRAADSLRDKALISCLFEGGFRIGELLPARVGDLSFNTNGVIVKVHGKTGPRSTLLIASVPLLTAWLENHPLKGKPGAPLWISNRGTRITYMQVSNRLKAAATEAGINKPVHPHLFRHSSASEMARYLNEFEMRIRYGWSSGSNIPSHYVHMANIDDKIVSLATSRAVEPPKPQFVPVKCPRCGFDNSPGQRFCGRCGTPLDPKELAKSSVEYEEIKRKMDEVDDIKGKLDRVLHLLSQGQTAAPSKGAGPRRGPSS
ncbi:MAG: tyrosine-type recombinase/integrase [Nitrososphaerota archaeon]|nr:tyrosine-type recombinase/integrase [Nitrososphaerota archaeon]